MSNTQGPTCIGCDRRIADGNLCGPCEEKLDALFSALEAEDMELQLEKVEIRGGDS